MKEKFKRSKPHCDLSKIGNIEDGMSTVAASFRELGMKFIPAVVTSDGQETGKKVQIVGQTLQKN